MQVSSLEDEIENLSQENHILEQKYNSLIRKVEIAKEKRRRENKNSKGISSPGIRINQQNPNQQSQSHETSW